MLNIWIVFLGFFPSLLLGSLEDDRLKKRKYLRKELNYYENLDQFYDPNIDYSRFSGRVSDKDQSGSILKIATENFNVKFYRAGDALKFKVGRLEHRDYCIGYVRDVERGFFVIFVKDFYPCWGKVDYFRRGTQLNFHSPMLAKRIKDAGVYRVVLIKRKRDFLKQLNDINHFVWAYDQKRVIVASKFDKRIATLERKKQKALDNLNIKKKDQLFLQKELVYNLDKLDKDIDYYRVERVELLQDRWEHDLDLGHPVNTRPQKMKVKKDIWEVLNY